MNTSGIKSIDQSSTVSRPVAVLSLDDFNGIERLRPGVPKELSPGVTLSILQTAAEGLLEIDTSKESVAEVNGKKATELATVQVGQIIKTSKGRFMMIRHLESFVVPREPGAKRPQYILDAMALAEASIAEDVSTESSKETHLTESKLITKVKDAGLDILQARPSVRMVVRASIGLLAVGIALMLIKLNSQDGLGEEVSGAASPNAKKFAKSTIVAANTNRDRTQAKDLGSSNVDESSVPVHATQLAKSGDQRVTHNGVNMPGPASPQKVARPLSNGPKTSVSNRALVARSVRLTDKDRQTIIEYKLEARFDRSNARAKLMHMAKSFPPGSPARAEVERAHAGL